MAKDTSCCLENLIAPDFIDLNPRDDWEARAEIAEEVRKRFDLAEVKTALDHAIG